MSELRECVEALTEFDNRVKYNQLQYFFPDKGPYRRELYKKHVQFLNAGKEFRERAIIAGNRIGKSYVAAFEVVCHATGLYPEWWEGKKFLDATRIWCASDSNEKVAEIAQEILVGSLSDIGTGLIPKHLIVDKAVKPGVTGALKTVDVMHVSGNISRIWFKSYQEGREGFQGTKRHVIWLDEECPSEIYTESLLRTMGIDGKILLTYTPLKGLSETSLRFLPQGKLPKNHVVEDCNRWVVEIRWDDNPPHLTQKDKDELAASMLPHERNARMNGIPLAGAGKVYIIPEEDFICDPIDVPVNWPRSFGMDVGWLKTAAVWFAYDRTRNTWYLYDEYYTGMQQLETHAMSIKRRGGWVPGVVDPSSKRANDEGKKTFHEYQKLGLNLRLADNTVDAGILKLTELLATGRLKVFSTCQNWLKEYRLYYRDDKGEIKPKQDDHAMDATRYWVNSGMRLATVKTDIDEFSTSTPRFSAYDNRDTITGC